MNTYRMDRTAHLFSFFAWVRTYATAMTLVVSLLTMSALPSEAKTSNNPKVALTIDLSTQTLTWEREGSDKKASTKVFPVSTGKRSTPTPTSSEGNAFVLEEKHRSYELKEVKEKENISVKVPYWMVFIPERGIAIHAVTNTWIGTYPSSGGCVRMKYDDARWLFENTPAGSKVVVKGSIDEYLSSNKMFPWEVEGQKDLIEPCTEEPKVRDRYTQYQFRKTLSPDMARRLWTLSQTGVLKIYKPAPAQIAEDSRWKKGNFVNFPNLEEMGNIRSLPFEECQRRYFTYEEFNKAVNEALSKGK